MSDMLLVVDANVVISSLLKKGITFDCFVLNSILEKYRLVAPEFLLEEVEKHREELLEETNLPEDEFQEVMGFLSREIDTIPASQFEGSLSKGREVSPDPKDFEYVALALKLDCPIFSGDKKLKQQSEIEVLSPRELLDSLRD